MKKTNIIYWTITGLFSAFMVFSSIGNVTSDEQSVAFLHQHLGFPLYMIPFLGVAKILGVIGILIPGFPRLKEWAYAGLTFDLVGALYSNTMVDGVNFGSAFMLVIIGFLAASYLLYHKRLKESKEISTSAKVAVG